MEIMNNDIEIRRNIVMLYILKMVNKPIQYTMYLELVTSLSDMTYFEFSDCLKELILRKYIDEIKSDDYILDENYEKDGKISTVDNINYLYILTMQGREVLDIMLPSLPGIERLKIDSSFSTSYKLIKDQYAISSKYLPQKSQAILEISDDNNKLIELRVRTETIDQVQKIMKTWKENAADIYIKIMELLQKENDKESDNEN